MAPRISTTPPAIRPERKPAPVQNHRIENTRKVAIRRAPHLVMFMIRWKVATCSRMSWSPRWYWVALPAIGLSRPRTLRAGCYTRPPKASSRPVGRPAGEQGAQGGDQRQGLVDHHVVVRIGDLDLDHAGRERRGRPGPAVLHDPALATIDVHQRRAHPARPGRRLLLHHPAAVELGPHVGIEPPGPA